MLILTRRQFVAGSVAAAMTPCLAWGQGHLQTARVLLDEYPSVDLHSHAGVFMGQGLPDFPQVTNLDAARAAAVQGMIEGRLTVACAALVADARILKRGTDGITVRRPFVAGEAWKDYHRQLHLIRALVDTAGVVQLNDAAAIGSITEGNVGCWITCEGADFLEGRIERVGEAHGDGVRMIQLVHYAQNDLGDLQTEPAKYDGLSEFGRRVVRELNRLGMVIDVAHAAQPTVEDVVSITEHPIVLSHSGLATDKWRHPRLINRQHAQLIADTGGVIGLWPSGFNNLTFADFIDNTLRLVDVVGADHVGLGTDMDGNYRPVFSSYDQLAGWIAALLNAGIGRDEVLKVMGGNARRLLKAVGGKPGGGAGGAPGGCRPPEPAGLRRR